MIETTNGSEHPACAVESPIGQGPCDYDLYVYAADVTGKASKKVGESVSSSGVNEAVTVNKAVGGHYLIVMEYYFNAGTSYAGKATLSNVVTAPVPAAPATPAPAFPVAGPLTAKLAPFATKLRTVARTGLPVTVTCSVVCRGTVTAQLSPREAQRLRLGRKRIVLGRAAVVVDSAAGTLVTLRPSKRIASKLARARSASISFSAALSAASGKANARRTAKLRR